MKETIFKNKTIVIVLCALVLAGIGFGAGMLVKTSMAKSGSSHMDSESAKQIALESVGVSPSKATFTKVEMDRDNGTDIYDIEFFTSALEYDFELNASNGDILEKNTEPLEGDHTNPSAVSDNQTQSNTSTVPNTAQNTGSAEYIGVSKAKEVAFQHAGIQASQATITKSKLDSDDGIKTYEIEFIYNNTEYDYEINAKTGDVLDYDTEAYHDYRQDHDFDD